MDSTSKGMPASHEYSLLLSYTQEGFEAVCVEWPGCTGSGDTVMEAVSEARRAICDSLEWMRKRGYEPPHPTNAVQDHIDRSRSLALAKAKAQADCFA